MPTRTHPATDSTPEQLRFPSISGFTIRADFASGELSSDFGAVVLSAVDHRIGLMDRLTDAITDTRDARRSIPTINWPVARLILVWRARCAAVTSTG